MTKLKPCPFCGGAGEHDSMPIGNLRIYFVSCRECSCQGRPFIIQGVAAQAWNDRALDAPKERKTGKAR